MERTLLVIIGLAGTGKSTAAEIFAKKHHYALLRQDIFLFEFNAVLEPKRGLTESEYLATAKCLHDCAKNYMELGRDVLIEGALAPVIEGDVIDVRDFISLAKVHGYKPTVINFTADDEVRKDRMTSREVVMPAHIDEKLEEANAIVMKNIAEEIVIDTSTISPEAVVAKLEEILGK